VLTSVGLQCGRSYPFLLLYCNQPYLEHICTVLERGFGSAQPEGGKKRPLDTDKQRAKTSRRLPHQAIYIRYALGSWRTSTCPPAPKHIRGSMSRKGSVLFSSRRRRTSGLHYYFPGAYPRLHHHRLSFSKDGFQGRSRRAGGSW